MTAPRPTPDPEGLLEYSVVFTDRSLNHMSAVFRQVMMELSTMLKQTYHAQAVALVPGGGTAAMEAVARQLATDKPVMVLRNGWFTFRWSQIFETCGVTSQVTVMKAQRQGTGPQAPFEPAPLDQVVARIAAERPAVVFAAHVETASGLLLPEPYLRAVAAATHAVGGLFVLDCVASGAVWVHMETTGVDVLLSAPQKGWSSSPSAGMVMMSAAARAQVKASDSTSFSLDLRKWLSIMEAYEAGGHAYHATMPTDALRGLHATMKEAIAFGLDKLQEAQWSLGRQIRADLQARGVRSVAAEGYEAPGVVVCYTDRPEVHTGQAFRARGVQIAKGVPLRCEEGEGFQTFRLGLFGLDKLYNVAASAGQLQEVFSQVL